MIAYYAEESPEQARAKIRLQGWTEGRDADVYYASSIQRYMVYDCSWRNHIALLYPRLKRLEPENHVAIVGSRSFTDFARMTAEADAFLHGMTIARIISGGARGADTLAIQYAELRKIPWKVIPAEWERYGKRAGIIRNREIVNEATHVLAFWDGESPGTQDTIKNAKKRGRIVHVVRYLEDHERAV